MIKEKKINKKIGRKRLQTTAMSRRWAPLLWVPCVAGKETVSAGVGSSCRRLVSAFSHLEKMAHFLLSKNIAAVKRYFQSLCS